MDEFKSELQLHQHRVQRNLGLCMVRLQQYEQLLKRFMAMAEFSGPPEALSAIQDNRLASLHRSTLGSLVGTLASDRMTTLGTPDDDANVGPDDQIWMSFRYRIEFSEERYQQTKAALKELVEMRNGLAHHFIERFNLWSEDGCAAAEVYLESCNDSVKNHYLLLTEWAKSMDELKQLAAEAISTQEFEDIE